jgi:hypothetical protein
MWTYTILSCRTERFPRTAAPILQGVLLLLMAGCSPAPQTERKPPAVPVGDSTAKRVEAIIVAAKQIDAATAPPGTANLRPITKELSHWEFSGWFDNSQPIFLSARFSEGQVVREETYYLRLGKLVLVRMEKWWDVDDSSHAPEPKTRQEFYIDNDQTIRVATDISSTPPSSRTNDTVRTAAALVERSRSITQILLGGRAEAGLARALEEFPDAETPQP